MNDLMTVAFYKGKDRIFNRLVSWWTVGPYSHVELLLSPIDPVSNCAWSASATFEDKGVRIKWKKFDPELWDFLEVPGDKAYAQDWITEHDKQGYDLMGLLGIVFRPVSDDKKKQFCNEAVGNMLRIPNAWQFQPNSFWDVLVARNESFQAGIDKSRLTD